LACGGDVFENPDGGTSDAGSTYCPSSPPAQGAACSDPNMWCEYGSDPDLSCNTVANCSNGEWSVQTPPSNGCPTPPNPSSCPASFASVPVGSHCGALVGTTCSYAQGFCGCTIGSGGPYPEDAAAVATWVCDAPTTGCPLPRPKLGTPCSQEGLQCDYSSCSLPTGVTLTCQSGAWQNTPFGCAL